jgi:hypothetical protein
VEEEQRYRVKWAGIFKRNLTFKHPYLINGAYYENIDDEEDLRTLDGWGDLNTKLFSDSEEIILKKKAPKRIQYDATGNEIPEPEPLPVPMKKKRWDIVYVLPFFAKPGKHSYVVKYKDTKEPR